MAGIKAERLPIEPLEEFMNADNVLHMARMLKMNPANIHRWRREGGIPVYKADQIACKTLGVHPAYIWRKEWVSR